MGDNNKIKVSYFTKTMMKCFFYNRLSNGAAELAYYLMFAFFPMLMFLSAMFSYINISREALGIALSVLPSELQELIFSYSEYIYQVPKISPMIIGVFMMLYSFTRAFVSLGHTINRIYGLKDKRKAYQRTFISGFFTLGLIIAIALNFGLIVVGRIVTAFAKKYFEIPAPMHQGLQVGRFIIPIAFVFGFFMMLYKIVPSRKITFKQAIPGSVFSMIGWFIASSIFAYFVDNLSRYSLLYGSLSAVIILMVWLYLTGVIIILGAQLNFVLMKSREKL